jgi:hypothetical protein
MAIANALAELKPPAEAFEDLQRQQPPAPPRDRGQDEAAEMTPAVVPVDYWQEADGSWAAHSPLLGVNAVGDSIPDLFVEMANQVDEYWAILNERYASLSEDAKALLQLRHLGLRFQQTTL